MIKYKYDAVNLEELKNIIVLLDRDGDILKSTDEYSKAEVCLIFDDTKVDAITSINRVIRSMVGSVQCIPIKNGIYHAQMNYEYGWTEWIDVTDAFRSLQKANIVSIKKP